VKTTTSAHVYNTRKIWYCIITFVETPCKAHYFIVIISRRVKLNKSEKQYRHGNIVYIPIGTYIIRAHKTTNRNRYKRTMRNLFKNILWYLPGFHFNFFHCHRICLVFFSFFYPMFENILRCLPNLQGDIVCSYNRR